MKIFIDGAALEVYPYDDNVSILRRYSLSKVNSLPEHLRFEGKDFSSAASEQKFMVSDLNVELKRLSIDDMNDVTTVLLLHSRYPFVTKRDLGMLWAVNNEVKEKNLDVLRKFSRTDFSSLETFAKNKTEFLREIERKRTVLQQKNQNQINLMSKIKSNSPIPVNPFSHEETVKLFHLKLENGESLLDIFDAIDVSKNVPFVLYKMKDDVKTKVFRHVKPSDEWTQLEPDTKDGLYIRLFIKDDGFYSKYQEDYYSLTYWSPDNEVTLVTSSNLIVPESAVEKRFFSSFSDRVRYEIIQQQQIGVKGTVVIPNFDLNRVIFAEMVMNDSTIRQFFFLSERLKTVLEKDRFYVYYEPQHSGSVDSALTITITPQIDASKNRYMELRISKARNIQQVEAFRYTLSQILALYEKKKGAVVDDYSQVIENFDEIADLYTKKEKVKKEKKTGKRADKLREMRPGMFMARYPDKCQQTRQPYLIVGEEEAKKKIKELKKNNEISAIVDAADGSYDNLAMNFPLGSQDYYFCAPREPNDKVQAQIWPGLMENKVLENKETFPLLPCCFLDDQYRKKKGGLRQYLDKEEKVEPVGKKADTSYVLGSNKLAPADRIAVLPYNLEKIAEMSDISKVKKGKDMIFSVVRMGVLSSPDSLIHCMERATNSKYDLMSMEDRRKLVEKIRNEWASLASYAFAKQELFDFADETIRSYLRNQKSFVDPRMFISFIEKHYRCRLLMFEVTEKNPTGEFILPRYSQMYFPKKLDPQQTTYIIVLQETGKIPQCELLCDLFRHEGKYNFAGTKFVEQSLTILSQINSISMVSVEETKSRVDRYDCIDTRSSFFKEIKKQFIDSNGKTRGIYVQGVFIITPPLSPFDVPEMKQEQNTFKKAMEFIQANQFTIREQQTDKKSCIGLWVDSKSLKKLYIPIESTPILKGVAETDSSVVPPLCVNEDSELCEILRKKKIANYLMTYSLYLYSQDPGSFSLNSFVVDEKHDYDIESLRKKLDSKNSVMWRGSKLIVPSEEARKRLYAYVFVYLTNDRKTVQEFKNRKLVPNNYISLQDFRKSPDQIVFSDIESLMNWKKEEKVLEFSRKVFLTYQDSELAYFYRNPSFPSPYNSRIAICQNVKDGDLETATAVCEKWSKDRLNPGFDPGMKSSDPVMIFSEDGKQSGKKSHLIVLEKNGKYSALLFI